MMVLNALALASCALLLAGCSTASAPDQAVEVCAKAFQRLNDPNFDPVAKQALLETMRGAGCMGRRP